MKKTLDGLSVSAVRCPCPARGRGQDLVQVQQQVWCHGCNLCLYCVVEGFDGPAWVSLAGEVLAPRPIVSCPITRLSPSRVPPSTAVNRRMRRRGTTK